MTQTQWVGTFRKTNLNTFAIFDRFIEAKAISDWVWSGSLMDKNSQNINLFLSTCDQSCQVVWRGHSDANLDIAWKQPIISEWLSVVKHSYHFTSISSRAIWKCSAFVKVHWFINWNRSSSEYSIHFISFWEGFAMKWL